MDTREMHYLADPMRSPGLPSEIQELMAPEPNRDQIKHNGLTGEQYAKRKSRSKIAKQSQKRNRGR